MINSVDGYVSDSRLTLVILIPRLAHSGNLELKRWIIT